MGGKRDMDREDRVETEILATTPSNSLLADLARERVERGRDKKRTKQEGGGEGAKRNQSNSREGGGII